jgi:predicted nucleic acid-binding protein
VPAWCVAREAFLRKLCLKFDLQDALRQLKPHKRTQPLERRSDSDLPWATQEPVVGGALFLDTSVYLDVLRGRSPEAVDDLLAFRICHHSAVCLSELMHVFGRLDPAHTSTKPVLKEVRQTIDDIPTHRLHAPDTSIWGQAGVLAGTLFRLSNLPKGEGHERRFLNDALISLQARALGACILTGNVRDFDYINQLVPSAQIMLYRPAAPSS